MSYVDVIRDERGFETGYRCAECRAIVRSMWGDTCNECRENERRHQEMIAAIKSAKSNP